MESEMIKSEFQSINKLSASERQLKEAIRLLFEQRDPVSIHTLTAAAYQILHDISKKKGYSSFLKDFVAEKVVKEERRKDWIRLINKAQNFFKHADKDDTDIIEFSSETTAFLIFGAVEMYRHLTGGIFHEAQVFTMWFFLKYEDFLLESNFKQLVGQAKRSGPSSDNINAFLDLLYNPNLINQAMRTE